MSADNKKHEFNLSVLLIYGKDHLKIGLILLGDG